MIEYGVITVKNQDIRRAAAKANVKLWQVADALGKTDSYFSRMLRKELPAQKKSEIFSIIRELSEQGGN